MVPDRAVRQDGDSMTRMPSGMQEIPGNRFFRFPAIFLFKKTFIFPGGMYIIELQSFP
jgi:hypothetical protein